MKNQFNIILLILLLNLIFSNSANAQYESIFGESTTKMQMLTIDNMPVEFATGEDGFFSNTTVTVDGQVLHEFKWFSPIFTGEWEEIGLLYYLREQTDEGKVWLIPNLNENNPPENLDEEILVVDMSLEVGDEFEYYADPPLLGEPVSPSIIIVIDVFYENGKKHIVFDESFDPGFSPEFADWGDQNLMFIEGFGSSYGYVTFGVYGLAKCVEKDGIVLGNPHQPLADLCDLETFSSPNEEFTNTSLYPNPATTSFQVNYPSEIGTSELKIFNLQGKLIFQKFNYQKENIDVTGFSSGVYFVELTSREGEVWRKKLIKE